LSAQNRRVCIDVGTGTGKIIKQIHDKFERVIGIDVSDSQL
jgi:ubiquinone/menaquinone biosynthesis C-methylase UbiE